MARSEAGSVPVVTRSQANAEGSPPRSAASDTGERSSASYGSPESRAPSALARGEDSVLEQLRSVVPDGAARRTARAQTLREADMRDQN